jgi:DNA-binding protein HU-beta
MTKRQFVERAAAEAGLQKTTAAKAIEAGLNLIGKTLSQDEDISLTGFGTFSVTHWPERTGFNPKTHQRISIPASRVPHFKPGRSLKRAIND